MFTLYRLLHPNDSNLKRYWKHRGTIYYSDSEKIESLDPQFKIQEKVLIECLKNISFDSCLEVGGGYGRISKIILENFKINNLTISDLSDKQIKNAKKFLQNDSINYVTSDIDSLNFEDKFELVIAITVLMHISDKDIVRSIRKLHELSSKYIIHLDASDFIAQSFHVFDHDYEKIHRMIDPNINIKTIKINKQKLFLIQK